VRFLDGFRDEPQAVIGPYIGISKNPNCITRQISCEIMEGVWSDSKTFKLIDLFEHVVYTMYSQTITITEQEKGCYYANCSCARYNRCIYKFECDYAHGRLYAHGGPYEQG